MLPPECSCEKVRFVDEPCPIHGFRIKKECQCDMRTKLVGDGCDICNPELALDHAKEAIEDLEGEVAEMVILLSRALSVSKERLLTVTNKEYDQVFNEIKEYLDDYK